MKNVVNKQHGFTLLEMVVVVAVLGLIATMATEFVAHETNQSRYDLTKERRSVIRDALSNYYTDCSEFPDKLNWLVVKSNLDGDRCGPFNADWAGPYILDVDFENGVPFYRDGWGNNANAVLEPDFGWLYDNNVSSVALATLGLDGVPGQTSASSAVEYYEFERDEGDGYTLLSTPSSTNYYLISVDTGASTAVSVLSCREGSATTSAAEVSMSNCI